jgi:cytochrome c peroxidase
MHPRPAALLVISVLLACGDDGGGGADSTDSTDSSSTSSGSSSSLTSVSAGDTTEGDTTSGTTQGGSTSTGEDGSSGSSSSGGGALGCDAARPQIGLWTPEETAIACGMSPLPELPASPTNAFADDDAAATLGQQFYFESDWAGPLLADNALGTAGTPGLVSCRACHDTATFASADPLGVGTGLHPRHAPGSVNAAYFDQAGFTWRGRFDVMWALPRAVFEAGVIFNSSRLRVAHVVFEQYQAEYDAVFASTPLPDLSDFGRFPATGRPKASPADPDGPWEMMTPEDQEAVNVILANVGKALEAYQRRLVAGDAPFDDYVAGDDAAISESAQRGFQLFVGKAGCVACHDGALFSDQSYRNLGLEASDGDLGRFSIIGAIGSDPFNGAGAYSDDPVQGQMFLDAVEPLTDDLQGRFRVPTVRDAARSAPYMHNGSIATLAEVIDFYDAGGTDVPNDQLAGDKDPLIVPLSLSDEEQVDLEAFIEALDGADIPPALTMNTAN